MMKSLLEVLMERDELSREEALELIDMARQRVLEGDEPEDVLYEEFQLEADYVWDIMS